MTSAAQVALHYSYKLEEALELSHETRKFLLHIRDADIAKHQKYWDDTLGTTWSLDEFIREPGEATGPPSSPPTTVTLPLLLATAPKAIHDFKKELRKKYAHAVAGKPGVEAVGIDTLPIEHAKQLLLNLPTVIVEQKK